MQRGRGAQRLRRQTRLEGYGGCILYTSEGVDPRELYGAQNVYLEQIKSLHPTLKIVARGQSLKVLGPEADTQRFARRMEGLAAYYIKYGHVSAEVSDQCFAGGIAPDDAPVDKRCV